MNKRSLLIGAGTFAAASIPMVMEAQAASTRNTATWKVPPGVNKIRVRSWNADGSPDMDRTLSVEPNQTFRIDAIE